MMKYPRLRFRNVDFGESRHTKEEAEAQKKDTLFRKCILSLDRKQQEA